jgi:hypothetical protein
MTHCLSAITLFCLAAAACAPASAQELKPGLWEVQNKIKSGNTQMSKAMAEMQKQLASMPPAQRKAMEEMMAKHGVSTIPTFKDGGMSIKVCMTAEMIAQNQMPIQQHGNCSQQRSAMKNGSMTISFQCTDPASSGKGTVRMVNENSYAMTMDMTIAHAPGGTPETTTMESSGTWLGANCGNIKPIVIPGAQ